MPIIRHAHHGADAAHADHLLPGWPEDCEVQWGGSGIVLGGGNSRMTAFFEAFPSRGGFIRGEGATIPEAETQALAQYRREHGCAHEWSRKHYRNSGGLCRLCGSFQLVFKEIVTLGAWRAPLDYSEISTILSGGCYPNQRDDGRMPIWRRRIYLRGRAAGIEIPDPADFPGITHPFDNPYSTASKLAVYAWIEKNGGQEALDQADERGEGELNAIFSSLSRIGVRRGYAQWLESRSQDIDISP